MINNKIKKKLSIKILQFVYVTMLNTNNLVLISDFKNIIIRNLNS